VQAEDLSVPAILNGIRAGCTFVDLTASSDIVVDFDAESSGATFKARQQLEPSESRDFGFDRWISDFLSLIITHLRERNHWLNEWLLALAGGTRLMRRAPFFIDRQNDRICLSASRHLLREL
jgi:hypothetical protein